MKAFAVAERVYDKRPKERTYRVIDNGTVNPRDVRLMRVVASYAEGSEEIRGSRTAALIHIKGGPEYWGRGKTRTDPFHAMYGHNKWANCPHAETDALKRASADETESLGDSTMYVFRLKRNGRPGLAFPCEDCVEAIRNFGIERVVYSTSEVDRLGVWEIDH
jgi:deoxycytidylate deaminase